MNTEITAFKRKGFWFAILCAILGQLAIDIYLPSFPAISVDLHLSHGIVQLSITTFLIGSIFSQLIYGPLADRYGRRIVLLIGVGIFFFACLGTVMVSSSKSLLISRFIQGIGIGSATLMARVIMSDLFEGYLLVRNISILGMAWVCVPIIAPVIGGYIETYLGWRVNFILLAGLALIMWGLLFWNFQETQDASKVQSFHIKAICKNYMSVLSYKPTRGYILSAIFLYGMLASFYTQSPFLLQDLLGLSPVLYGWSMLLTLANYAIGRVLNTYLIHHFDPKQIIRNALICAICVNILNVFVSSYFIMTPLLFLFPLFLLVINLALISSNCLAMFLSFFPHLSGTASALYGAAIFIGGSMASLMMSILPKTSFWPFSVVLLGQCLIAFVILSKSSLKKMDT